MAKAVKSVRCPHCGQKVLAHVELTPDGHEKTLTCPECGHTWPALAH